MFSPPESLPRHELERGLRRARALNVALGVIAAAGVVFGGVQLASPSGDQAAHTGGSAGASEGVAGDHSDAGATHAVERRLDGDPMAIGALDAPVVMSEWIDFRCPFCAVFSRDTFPQLVQEYVDDGLVRIEIHDVAFFGEQSERAAVAARAAAEQGLYFEYVEAIYHAAPESGHPELPTEQLIEFATQVGVPDIEKFAEDMQRSDLYEAVRASTTRAQQLGVTGVPFFAVGEQAISGAQPLEVFRQFLEPHLAEG